MSPGLKSRNLKGPVPTGLRFVGASRDLSPLKAWKRCLGMIGPVAAPQNAAAQNGVGCEGLAIVPGDVLLELPRHGHAVLRDLAVLWTWRLGRENRHQVAVGIE